MIDVQADRAELDASTEQLLIGAGALSDELAAAPSGLPGWSRAMVVTHLARNANGVQSLIEAAARGQVGVMYPGGRSAREEAIAAGAQRRARELIADLRLSAATLREAAGRLDRQQWEAMGETLHGPQPLWAMLVNRRREVEVHHVDLDLGYTPASWPTDFVAQELAAAVGRLPARLPEGVVLHLVATDRAVSWTATGGVGGTVGPSAPARGPTAVRGAEVVAPSPVLLAWLLGRAPAPGPGGVPELEPWG